MTVDFGDRDGAMRRWLKGSAFADGGQPTVLYHGTDIHDEFNIFTYWGEGSIGFHFGTREVANARLEGILRHSDPDDPSGIVIPVICRARNPLRLPDLMLWDQDDIAWELHRAGVLGSEEEVEHVIESISEAMVFAAIEEAGYDCVVYGNACEHKDEVTDSVMLWRAELMKSPFASSFDPSDPRLLPQREASPHDYRSWERLSREIQEARQELLALRDAAVRDNPSGP